MAAGGLWEASADSGVISIGLAGLEASVSVLVFLVVPLDSFIIGSLCHNKLHKSNNNFPYGYFFSE